MSQAHTLLQAYSRLTKQALDVDRGGLPSRLLASTVGEVGNTLGIVPPIMSLRTYVNPKR